MMNTETGEIRLLKDDKLPGKKWIEINEADIPANIAKLI